jgi:predicted secreted protein
MAGGPDVILGEKHSGQTLTLKVGETVRLELPGRGGTGFSWYLEHLDSGYLDLVSQETARPSPGDLVGAPVVHIWRFRAQKVGQTYLKLAYYRQWEGSNTATRHFLLNINIIGNDN